MTLEEAIKILSELHDQCCQADSIFCTDTTGARCEAVDMAISALQAQDAPDTNVGDMIYRQAAIDAADRADYTGLAVEDVKKVTDEVVKEIKKLPSAQPEIVRCKDCKHWRQQINCQDDPLSFGFCESYDMWRSLYGETTEVSHIETVDDFYCGYAERRTDDSISE